MMQSKTKKERAVVIILLFATIACFSVWYVRNYYRVRDMTRIESKEGTFDLKNIDFDHHYFHLKGDVMYLPGALTPEEFKAKEDTAQPGNPWDIPCATSKVSILVPEDRIYTITTASIDFAHRVYVNGELRFEAGNPADNADDFKPGYAQMTLDVKPVNGVIEIIQQGANFVHREGGGHTNFYFGNSDKIQRLLAMTYVPEVIYVGLFGALFLVHLILYIIQRNYKPNFIFSLLCFTWMIRTGITGAKIFYAVFPSLPWELAFRSEYLSLPIAAILMILLIRMIFPSVPQKWFVRILCTGSILFSALCLLLDTVTLSYTLVFYEAFFSIGILYLFLRFIMKIPVMVKEHKLQIEHMISLIGILFFMIATINDALYHGSIYHAMGLKRAFILTGLAMLIFSLFQMTAMFYGTMREAMLAHEREKRAESEKEMLSEMNRMKSAFYSDLSHEMKTPLTVIAVNAQFAAQNITSGAVDEETITDLNAISTEAKRLAQMVTSLVGIGRMQGAEGQSTSLNLASLISETTRIYQTLFARKKNTLTAEIEPDISFVQGNADQIIQVLINLLSNANRHTSQGAVHIYAKIADHMVQVSVTDTGSGIDSELLPHVFERYRHGEQGGSGLGLAICKKIVEEHGGEIGVESEEGKGTTVWFTLPKREERE